MKGITAFKSVTIEDITEAYDHASLGNGFAKEIMRSPVEVNRARGLCLFNKQSAYQLSTFMNVSVRVQQTAYGVDPDALKA